MKVTRPKKASGGKPADGRLSLLAAGVGLPHPDKEATGGEDAHMVHISRMGGGAVAVADGVGGWNAKGVNPAAYSRCLVHFARVAAVQEERERQTTAKATGLMAMVRALAAGLTKKDLTAQGLMSRAQVRSKVPGSATMVVARLDGETGTLDVCNLGDAGLRVLREGRVVATTQDQQYEFDMPYQMACQEFVDIEYNKAKDGNRTAVEVKDGDWLILGSDGLFDNMYDEEIAALQMQAETKGKDAGDEYFQAQVIARALAERARRYSRDPLRKVPYGVALAESQGGKRRGLGSLLKPTLALGGKPDDITVVVARVTALSPTNVGAFQTATQDAQAAAMEVQQVAEKAIAFNAVKPGLPKLPGGTIKVRKQK